MKLHTRFTALLTALALILSISPVTVSFAEDQVPLRSLPERETIPEYTQALEEFENLYEQQLASDRQYAETTPAPVEAPSGGITSDGEPGIMPMSVDDEGVYIPDPVDSKLQIRADDYQNVSLGTGGLNFTYPILSLKGKNGLDVNLSLQYDSAVAVNDAPTGALYSGVTGKPQEYNDWGIGMGWSFSAPKINKNNINLPDGSSLPVKYMNNSGTKVPYICRAFGLEWARKDVYMSGSGTIKMKDGSSITRSGSQYTYQDRFNNKIVYNYSGSHLTSIVDSVGRRISFTYSDYLVTVSLDGQDYCKIYRDKSKYGTVTKIENAMGDTTSFEYERLWDTVTYTGGNQDVSGPNRNYPIDTYNMTKITYPTGSYSAISYTTYSATTDFIRQRPKQYLRYMVSSIVKDDHLLRYVYTRTPISGTYNSYISYIHFTDNDKVTKYELATSGNILKETVTIPQTEIVTQSRYNSADLPMQRTVTINGNANTKTEEKWTYMDKGSAFSITSDVTEYIDPLGNKTEATYNYWSLPITKKIYSPDGTLKSSTTNTFPTSGSLKDRMILSSETDSEGIVTKTDYAYDEYGQIISKTATEQGKGSITTQYAYDYTQQHAQPVAVTVKDVTTNSESFQPVTYDNITEYTYDITDRLLTEKLYTGADSALTTTYEYYADGMPKKVTAPNSSSVEYTYTLVNGGTGRSGTENTVLTITTGTDGSQRQIKDLCDEWGRVAERWELNNGSMARRVARYTYWYGLIRSAENEYGVKTVYTVDPLGRITKVKAPDETSINIYYDDENGKQTVYNQLNVPYTTVYDKFGRKVREETVDGERTVVKASYTYDWRSLPVSVTDALGAVTATEYDGAGRVVKVTDALGQQTSYEYGFGERVTKTTTPGGSVYETEYDTLGNVTKTKDALGSFEYFAYNRLGNVVKAQDKNGTLTTTSYLAGTQLPSRVEKAKPGEATEGVSYTYNGFGEIISKTNLETGSAISYTYRYNGQPETVTQGGKTLRYEYNNQGQLSKVTDYYGASSTYEYDALGRISGITQDGRKTSYSYDAAGQATGVSFGGIYTASYAYNDNGTLASLENKYGQTQINRFTYTYDDNGNQLSKVETGKSTETYSYDALGRLERVAVADAATTYTYDANGNIATVVSPGKTVTNSYDAQNKLIERVSATADATETTHYSYDAVGNLYSEAGYVQSASGGEAGAALGTVGGNNPEGVGKTAFYGYNKRMKNK